ncbi:hypothetical protein NQ317_014443 [Molorchus minor]|uniref:Phosphatidylinositol 3-kinase catalytic subunit type 3 n=1 Tax=Molorchus minor TaxID=1323400 RepID=A0ABQ9K658_9CUCU|nr:hypothetical protein NQ317_014443 [Molorchus minor]
MMEDLHDKFYYTYSSSVSDRIQIKIGNLEGKRKKPEYDKLLEDPMLKYSGLYQDGCADLMVVCQIFDQKSTPSFTRNYVLQKLLRPDGSNWNEWLNLPVQFNDLPRTAQLALTIYDCYGPNKLGPVGGTTVSLFSKHGLFRQTYVFGQIERQTAIFPPLPLVKLKITTKNKCLDCPNLPRNTEMAISPRRVDWLDRLTFRELELINEKEKRCSDYLYLMIEFPTIIVGGIAHHIVYFEPNGEDIVPFRTQTDLVTVPDQEILKEKLEKGTNHYENLVESKHHKLARSLRSGHCDKDAKPNATMRDILNTIVSYPPTKNLSNEEQDHVWKYRFYLSTQKKALAKFLKCVNWNQHNEVRQALHMMEIWAPMDVEDALELLSPNFTHQAVRRYAISRLQQAPDEDIFLYLVQLVQALKYENFKTIQEGYTRISPGREVNFLSDEKEAQLEKKDSKESNSTITNESVMHRSSSYNQADQIATSNVNSVIEVDPEQRAASLPENIVQNINLCTDSGNTDTLQSHINEEEEIQDLASFLIHRACKNFMLANYFYWYLLLECEDQEPNLKQDLEVRDMYLTVMKTFSQTLARGTESMQKKRYLLTKQQKFIDKLVKLMKTVSRESGNRKKKAEKLQQLLADSDNFKFNFSKFEPIPFPLDPGVIINGIISEKASLFKSALMPSKLHFKTVDNEEYVAIFKHGDDLRQDQLILQMITLMDKLLQKENLDLKLTPYRVLATSTKHGFVQFIES